MKLAVHKKTWIWSLALLPLIGIFVFGPSAQATVGDWATSVLSGLLSVFIWGFGIILVLAIQSLIFIASYQQFIGAPAVILGWVIVRDICNMFFVVALIIIAFGTILHLENYNYKKWLPKLILMAILINFSKTICGLLIDVTQVVMLTFVNAFKDIGGANLTDMLGITKIVTMAQGTNNSFITIIGAYLLGIIYLLVSIVVIVTMLMMLVMRLVMIWIYVVLSPAAYLLAAFPGGEKYASQWWSEFIKNLVVGPVLAFFIWLSLASLAGGNNLGSSGVTADTSTIVAATGSTASSSEINVAKAGTEASTPAALIQFVIAIGMLVGGLMVSQQIGGAAGGLARKGMSALQKGQGLATGAVLGGVKGLGRFAGKRTADLRDMASETMGVDLNLAGAWKRRGEQSEANRQLRQQHIRKNTLAIATGDKRSDGTSPGWLHRKAALLSTGDVAWQNIIDKKHHIFSAGSPKITDKTLAQIGDAEQGTGQLGEKKRAQDRIKDLEQEKNEVVTRNEYHDNMDKVRELSAANLDLNSRRTAITSDPDFIDLQKKEQNRTITEGEKTSLNSQRDQLVHLDENIKGNNDEITDLRSRNNIVNSGADKAAEQSRIARQVSSEEAHIGDIDTEIKRLTAVLTKNKLSEIQTSRAHVDSTMEAEANKKIATITNSDQLVAIIKEAIESKDQGLVAAAYKKITKTGNYNDIHRELNLGTGYEGMVGMAEHLQKDGGFSEQDARALVAEAGEIAKSVNHYQAFAAMSMDKAGQWQPTGKDQQQANIFSELSKVQIQKIVRDLNRLAAGEFKSGMPHTAANWEMSPAMVAIIAAKDEAFAKQLNDTGSISMAQFIGSKPENIQKLIDNGARVTAKAIQALMEKSKDAKVTDPLVAIRSIT